MSSRDTEFVEYSSWVASLFFLAMAAGTAAVITFDPAKNFVHPTNFQDILSRTVSNGLGLHWTDVQNAIAQFGPSESRPRFLAILIEEYDLKARLFLTQFTMLPVTFRPISWFFHIFVGPFFLYRLVRNLGGDRTASTMAVAVYLSSVGFLSALSMAFIPGKPLTTDFLIVAMYCLSTIPHMDARAKFSDAPVLTIVGATVAVFAGLFCDEVGLFAFPLLAIMFWPLFWNPAARPLLQQFDWKGIGICALPGVIFLLIVVVIVPSFYENLFHRPFDYLGNVFAVGIGAQGAKSMFEGPHGTFGWPILWLDFKNLFGVSVVPLQLSPFTTANPQDISLIQTSNPLQYLGLSAFFGILIICAMRRIEIAAILRRILAATIVFAILMTWLSIRHNPIIIGYYYGASTSLFTALLVALGIANLSSLGSARLFLGVLAAGAIVLIQINNFMFINERWRTLHVEYVIRSISEKQFRLSEKEVTVAELSAIRAAWKQGQLESYLNTHEISAAAVPVVYELRTIEQLNPRPAA